MTEDAKNPPQSTDIAHGGRNIYGARVGILMLESRFPRIPGDMGNAATWPFPVQYRVVPGASPNRVVRQGAAGLLDDFVAAGRDLIAHGVDGISTTCGFLSLFQAAFSAQLSVPVASSSLMQVPLVDRLLPPDKRTGVLTISAASLTADHLTAAGAPADTPVVGTDGGKEFSRVILDDEIELNVALAREDHRDAAADLMRRYPEVGAIVLECANMAPYAPDIRAAAGVPVYSIVSFVSWFQSGLAPRDYR